MVSIDTSHVVCEHASEYAKPCQLVLARVTHLCIKRAAAHNLRFKYKLGLDCQGGTAEALYLLEGRVPFCLGQAAVLHCCSRGGWQKLDF